jgi:hypothetical protein
METYRAIREAYLQRLRAHQEERAAREARAGVQIEGRSTLENARVVREELKRQVIEMLLGERFTGEGALEFDADGRPRTDLNAAIASAPRIQFIEQVFEWEHLTYVLYPYFWSKEERWTTLQPIASTDADYARFLRAGSARVVVSTRPGFQHAVQYFLATSQPWTGGAAPVPDDTDYISVADEIEAQTGAPDDGIRVGPSWEVRLPTTLVALDPDPTLPKLNAGARIPAPPDPA